jgi:hypothetical protein
MTKRLFECIRERAAAVIVFSLMQPSWALTTRKRE